MTETLTDHYLPPFSPIPAHWKNVRKDKNPINWVTLGFEKGDKRLKKCIVEGSGKGGLAEFVDSLKDDEIQYGGFVVYVSCSAFQLLLSKLLDMAPLTASVLALSCTNRASTTAETASPSVRSSSLCRGSGPKSVRL